MTHIATKKMTRKERRLAPARVEPADTPDLRAEILRLLRHGSTMTEICGLPHMPPLATLFKMRRADPVFGQQYLEAMEDHSEALITAATEMQQAAADAAMDLAEEPVNPSGTDEPVRASSIDALNAVKSTGFFLDSALKYAAAMVPHKYGATLKQVSAEIGGGVSITVTSYATNPAPERSAGVSDTGSPAPLSLAASD